ncbi:hypothetical protein ACODNH_09435 [Haloarcula sp. NS06]|nr:hypothetical protein [Haloarcula sp. H-GB4]MDQ2073663.1 hypothetical protein [Haloarcula sp. H-GB4]
MSGSEPSVERCSASLGSSSDGGPTVLEPEATTVAEWYGER